MAWRHSCSVFLFCGRMGFRQVFAQPLLIFGSFLTYAVIMLLYAGVIRMIPQADLARFGFGANEMIWYLGVTEYVLFATPSWCFKELQNEVTSGQIHLAILRPVSGAFMRMSVWAGEGVARALVLFLPFMVLMFFLGGGFVMSFTHMAGLVLSIPLSVALSVCGWFLVGASCLWFIQSEPAFWVWQKAIFLLGAMMWPMAFYPLWLQVLCWITPFPGILAIAGRWALEAEAWVYAAAFAHQIFWAAVMIVLVGLFEGKILRRIQETGA